MRAASVPPLDPAFVEAARQAWTRRVGHAMEGRTRETFTDALSELVASGEAPALPRTIEDLELGPLDGPVLQGLVRRLFNNETYFFRDSLSTETLFAKVLPELLWERRKLRRLTVWSAGCSTGEELYTLAILLSRLIPAQDEWRLTLVGSDLSMAALGRARLAVYAAGALRNTSDEERRTLFIQRDNQFELREQYRRNVQFGLENMVEPGGVSAGVKFDLVLSRNVAIYLDPSGQQRWARKVVEARADDGILITAPTDPLPPGAGHSEHVAGLSVHRRASRARAENRPPRLPAPTVPESPAARAAAAKATNAPSATFHSRVQATPRAISRPKELSLSERLTKARVLGDSGRLEAALELLDDALLANRANAEIHELRGVLLEALARPEHAAKAYRRATEQVDSPRLWLRLGLLLEQLGAFDDAADAFLRCRAAASSPADAEYTTTALSRLVALERRTRR